MKEKVKYNKKVELKNKVLILGLLFFVIIGIIVVPSIFATLQPIKSIEILSSKTNYSSKEGGAWKVTNSAEFISNDTVKVTVDLDTIAKGSSKYKDVVFLLDMSKSMIDERLNTLKSGVATSIEKIMEDENNKVGIISFNSSSTLVSNLSNNKSDLINKVNSLTTGVGTSYYQALINLDNILKNYENDENRELKVIFITDGMPSKESPNEVGEYKYLKDKYSYLKIDAVQYEAGDKVFESLEKISDRQEIVSSSDLERKLINISTSATSYESFTIKENLNNDNFNIESINDIKVDTGSVSLNNNVVTWNLDNIGSGSKAEMSFNAKLKTTSNGVYELNNNIEVSSLIGEVNDAVTSTKTPVLSNNYKVKYDGNKPSDCTISGVPDEATHKVFEAVSIADSPKCNGYQFKGWDIVTNNVTKINDDYFVMPEEDVELKANWSKLDIKKSTDGVVEEGWTLYKQVKSDTGSSNRYAKKYTGDTSTFTGNNDVYYYYGEAANNNVIFANYCWKIVRTTDTGGVKLLYNGVPSNGTCNNTGEASALTADDMGTSSNQIAFNTNDNSLANVGYMYNTRYTFNSKETEIKTASASENQFAVSSEIIDNGNGLYTLKDAIFYDKSNWNTEYTNIKNKYTCGGGSTTCSDIKFITEASYTNNTLNYTYTVVYKFGNSFTYSNGKYNLVNTIIKDADNNHHYTCFNLSGECNEINYINNIEGKMYYIILSNGKNINDAINEMLYNDDVNKYDSTIKKAIDYWYSKNMTEYTKYLEDTVWCNDRVISYKGGWNPNGGALNSFLYFKNNYNSSDLTCLNKTDQFSVSSSNGNGALTYPVGMITRQEQVLAFDNSKSPLASGRAFWGISPRMTFSSFSAGYYVIANGSYEFWWGVAMAADVRPMISLKKDIEYLSGNGSSDYPYIISME